MKPELILQADILDIIFEDRNKEYGAYNLRKHYDGRMKKAMSAVLLLVAGIFLLNSWNRPNNRSESSVSIITEDSMTLVTLPETEPPPLEPPKEKTATISNPTFLLTNDSVTDSMPTIEELTKDVRIGLITEDGAPSIGDAPPPEQSGTNTEKVPVTAPAEENRVLDRSEVMPEFPGGQAAFIRFLSKNLRVPENSLDPGQKIKIIIRFVVGREGELYNMQFIKPGGEVFEQEVIRVMKKMPKWKPGTQNGEKVQVYFNLPIIFETSEE